MTKAPKPFRLAALICLALAPAGQAQPIEEKRVSFATGTSGATIRGALKGEQITDYLLGASAGQTMNVDFSTTNPAGYFNLMIGNDPAAIHIGSVAGNHYSGVLPASGDYRIRVYLMRSAARRGESADYTLSVSIGGAAKPAPVTEDYADGLAGGPDWWQVTGVAANDTLNVRAGPGTGNAVIGQLANGDRVRNLGCRMSGQTRWCQVEIQGDMRVTGWAAGRYLAEAGAPAGHEAQHEARGMIPCATASGQPMGTCSFRVSRGSGGTASVWVALPGGGERYLDFREGQLVGSDPGTTASHSRNGDLNMVSINGTERYELPDAVLYGG